MSRLIASIPLIAACFGPPQPVSSDSCACTLTPPSGMRQDAEVLGYAEGDLAFSSRFPERYLAVSSIPHAEADAIPLLEVARNMVTGDPPGRVLGVPTYHELAGTTAVSLHAEERVVGTRVRIHKRYTVLDDGARLLILQAWTPVAGWSSAEAKLDKGMQSLVITPSPPAPYVDAPTVQPEKQGLLAAREARSTVIPEPVVFLEKLVDPPEDSGWERTTYAGPLGSYGAYQSRAPEPVEGEVAKGPAVIYIEGGFGGPSDQVFRPQDPANDQSAELFRKAGLHVFVPSFRGEMGNPGHFEMFYGETADLLAALEHVRGLPHVDPDRVYLVGHSTGGTHVLSAAVASEAFRAAFVLGGRADLAGVASEGGYGDEPFDIEDADEIRLRSPIHWVGHLTRPTYLFEGAEAYLVDLATMAQLGQQAGKPISFHPVPGGDHFTIQRPVKDLIIEQIMKDTGPEPAFAFDEPMLARAMKVAGGG